MAVVTLDELLSSDDIVAIGIVGIAIPVILAAAGQAHNGIVASSVAALLFVLTAWAASESFDVSDRSVRYAVISARLFTLTALGEAAVTVKRAVVRRMDVHAEMRMYECMAIVLCSFLVIGQVIEALEVLLPAEVDSGTFLGIVVAGISFSLRGVASCIIAGIFENVSPRFKVGDEITTDGVQCRVTGKTLCFVRAVDTRGCELTIPQNAIAKGAVAVARAPTVVPPGAPCA